MKRQKNGNPNLNVCSSGMLWNTDLRLVTF